MNGRRKIVKKGLAVVVMDTCPGFGSSKWVFVRLSVVVFVTCVLVEEVLF